MLNDKTIIIDRFGGRVNKTTGMTEEVRIAVDDFQGRLVIHCRVWYRLPRPPEGDDGWRPTKSGFTIRENESDRWISAISQVRTMIRMTGRPTDATPIAKRIRSSRADEDDDELMPWQEDDDGVPIPFGPGRDDDAPLPWEEHERPLHELEPGLRAFDKSLEDSGP